VNEVPTARRPEIAVGARRVVHLSLAGLYGTLAVVGAVLPLVPTTPFVLLTSYHLSRSSPRLETALRSSRLFGPFLRDWNERGGVRRSVKWVASLVVIAVVGLRIASGGDPTAIRVVLLVLAAVGLCVVWRLPNASSASHVARNGGSAGAGHPHGDEREELADSLRRS
jgi:uncharacterized protein